VTRRRDKEQREKQREINVKKSFAKSANHSRLVCALHQE